MARCTFDEIKEFAMDEIWVPPVDVTDRTALAHDFQIAGLDGQDFMEAYARRFGVDLADFDWVEYFGPEASGNPFSLLGYLWSRLVRRIPARDLVGLPELTLGHLFACANEGRWRRPER